ncbi:MAG TPA: DUF4012 domain-containing protein [bacterium]|nr:DUF4012 domain-containing protein [bacterium]
MEIKKHKIDILQDDRRSSFVVDLRNDKKEKILEEYQPNINQRGANESSDFLKREKSFNKFKKIIFKVPFNSSKFKKTSFYPVLFFIYKIIRAVVVFFVDWIKDILGFIKKILKLTLKINQRTKKNIDKKIKKEIKKEIIREKKIVNKIKNIPIINFDISRTYSSPPKKSIWFFVLFLFLLIVPFKLFSYYKLVSENKTQNNLMNYSFEALSNLNDASSGFSQLNLNLAQENFFQAGENFLLINQELNKIDEFIIFLASFSRDDKIKLASESKDIAKVGLYISSAGDNFSLAVDSLLRSLSDSKVDNQDYFSDFYFYSKKTEDDIKKINKYLKRIKASSIPEDYRDQFVDIREKSLILEKNFNVFLNLIPGIKDFLGIDSDRRYLIVFQNNSEIRATGGFIGSYAIVDLKRGKIANIEIPAGGSYDTEGGMRVLVEAPKPLHLVKSVWYFWDANWWPDWKMSAKNLMWFYEKSGGSSVDGVISITPDILGDILKIIGPVDLTEKYGVIIGEDNYWDIIQEVVEVIGQPEVYQDKDLKTDILDRVATSSDIYSSEISSSTIESKEGLVRNEPKKIIGDLMLEIMARFSERFDKDLLIKSLGIIEKNLSQKNILLYFTNKDIQNEVENRSWAGQVKEAPLDYLMIINSNIAGGKTDKVIDNNYSLSTKIDADGSIINKLTIIRKHTGNKSDLFYGVRNVNWLRVYVPMGSSLLGAKGFSSPDKNYFKDSEDFYEKNPILESGENRAEIDLSSGTKIYQESEKTVFANWTMLDPGQEQIIEIEYRLPHNFYGANLKNYSLLWQKQPGSGNINFNFDFLNNTDLRPIWTYPQNINSNNLIKFSGDLGSDRYLVIMFE